MSSSAFSLALALSLAASIAVAPRAAWAYFEDSNVGVRASGFAGAFTAIADDPSALYWNPAGLQLLRHSGALLSYSRPYAVQGLSSLYAAAAVPTRSGATLGFSWQRFAVSGAVSEDLWSAGAGSQVAKWGNGFRLSAGAVLKMAHVGFQSYTDPDNGQSVDFGSASKLTADLGLLLALPGEKWTAGYTVHNLGSPTLRVLSDPGPATEIPALSQLGVACHWNPESTISMDYQRLPGGRGVINLGGEIWFYNSFAIRGGLTGSDAGGGFSIRSNRTLFDMAFLTSEPLGASYRVGLRLGLP